MTLPFARSSSLTVLISAVLSVSACSSGGPSTPLCGEGYDRTAGPCGDALAAACAEHAAALCDKRLECHGAWYQAAVALDGDVTECVRKLTGTCIVASALPGTLLVPDELSACASAVEASTCQSLYGEPECVLPGARAAGEPCVHKYQCQSGVCSGVPSFDASLAWTCGVCAEAEGGACEKPLDCGAGLTCSAMSKTCVRESGEGQPCAVQLDCAGVLTCLDGLCQMGADAGGPCAQGACNGRRSLFCNEGSNMCEAATVVPAGQSCSDASAVPVACDAASFCNEAKMCEARSGDGGPCALSTPGPLCAFPAVCDIGTCRAAVPAGEACTGNGAQCALPTTCTDGVCRVTYECK